MILYDPLVSPVWFLMYRKVKIDCGHKQGGDRGTRRGQTRTPWEYSHVIVSTEVPLSFEIVQVASAWVIRFPNVNSLRKKLSMMLHACI